MVHSSIDGHRVVLPVRSRIVRIHERQHVAGALASSALTFTTGHLSHIGKLCPRIYTGHLASSAHAYIQAYIAP